MAAGQAVEVSVSQFVALLNQTLEYAYPEVSIIGELANVRVSRGRWLYFDLKDEGASVKFFGTVYQLPGPLEDGMLLRVRGQPRLHPLYGFSVNIQSIRPAGEGTIRRAADLLRAKLAAEGLFDEARKRPLPYPPSRIGLITSRQSAAYADFVKILNARWRGLTVEVLDVQVQGEPAPAQLVAALEQFNAQAWPPEVLVLIRGGGSAEDLAAFSHETITRAVAASRVPTLVAIGHEVDLSLAELAADQRASTPSNAAELLVPERSQVLAALSQAAEQLYLHSQRPSTLARQSLTQRSVELHHYLTQRLVQVQTRLQHQRAMLAVLDPQAVLRRGYAVVRYQGQALRSSQTVREGAIVEVTLADGRFGAMVSHVAEQSTAAAKD